MWKMKACPRCGGDMFITIELDTWYEQCLQCGCQRELKDIRVFWAQSEREKQPVLIGRGRSPNK